MFSTKNAVVVALMQTGVIVGGVLAAGTSGKVWKTMFGPGTVPASLVQLMTLGPLALVIPLVWIVSVLVLRQRAEVSDDAKSLGFGAGVLILVALILSIGAVVLRPWLGVDFGFRGNDE
jgi:hypothetical protein